MGVLISSHSSYSVKNERDRDAATTKQKGANEIVITRYVCTSVQKLDAIRIVLYMYIAKY